MTTLAPSDFEDGAPAAPQGVLSAGTSAAAPSTLSADAFENAPAQPADTGSFLANLGEAARNVPGTFAALPHVLAHTADYLLAHSMNAADGGNRTGADIDKVNPVAQALPTAEEFTHDYTYPAINATRGALGLGPITPYVPKTGLGQVAQAAMTAGMAGAVDPLAGAGTAARILNAGKAAVSGGVADIVGSLTNSPLATALSAFLTHAGASGVEGAARVGVPAAVGTAKRIVRPSVGGTGHAADIIKTADNVPGTALANPDPAAVAAAKTAAADAADAATEGAAAPYQAGQQIQSDLLARQKALTEARTAETAPLAAARDASTAPVDLDPVLATIAPKLKNAAGAQRTAIEGALSDLKMPSGALRVNADQLAASRQAINARISAAKSAGDNATASHLLQIRGALDQQVAQAVPEATQFTQKYADMSRPLDVFAPGTSSVNAVPNVVARDNFGNLNGTPPSEIPNSFLTGGATREKLAQLVRAYGGDRVAAQSGLEQHLAGVVQGALNPDGTLDQAAFDRAIKPYQKSLIWFPELSRKFATAKAAQGTYETLLGQRQIADSINSGGLRDAHGTITAQSFNSWLRDNRDVLAKSYDAGTRMRLQSIGNALKAAGPDLAHALVEEGVPGGVGYALGGTEGSIYGLMNHGLAGRLLSPYMSRRNAAFNAVMEQAVRDPAAAQRIAASITPAARLTGKAAANAIIRALSTATRVGPSPGN